MVKLKRAILNQLEKNKQQLKKEELSKYFCQGSKYPNIFYSAFSTSLPREELNSMIYKRRGRVVFGTQLVLMEVFSTYSNSVQIQLLKKFNGLYGAHIIERKTIIAVIIKILLTKT